MNPKRYKKLRESLEIVKLSEEHGQINKRAFDRATKKYPLCHLSVEQAIELVQIYPKFYVWIPKHVQKPEVELASKL